jgi:hypothetical protein
LSGLVRHPQAADHGFGNQMWVFKAGEVDEPDTVTHGPLKVGACAQGETGFANTARSHQRHEASAGESRLDLRQQASPSDEAR